MSLYGRVFAAAYDRGLAASERAGLSEMRARLLAEARDRTLELGAGTGLNLVHYSGHGIELTLTEPEAPMARRLKRRASKLRPDATIVCAPADRLPFDDASFDSVVCTLVLCTVPNPAAALAEIERVLAVDGRLLFLEHVRSDDAGLARWQDRLHGLWVHVGHGCHCNRDTLANIHAAGFEVDQLHHDRIPKAAPIIRPLIVGSARPTVVQRW